MSDVKHGISKRTHPAPSRIRRIINCTSAYLSRARVHARMGLIKLTPGRPDGDELADVLVLPGLRRALQPVVRDDAPQRVGENGDATAPHCHFLHQCGDTSEEAIRLKRIWPLSEIIRR